MKKSNAAPASNALAAQRHASFNRRRFLRGLGACLAVPAFDSLRFPIAAAGGPQPATTATGAPLRMAFVYFPNGAIQDAWWPEGEGKEFALGRTMQPLAPLKNQLQICGQ